MSWGSPLISSEMTFHSLGEETKPYGSARKRFVAGQSSTEGTRDHLPLRYHFCYGKYLERHLLEGHWIDSEERLLGKHRSKLLFGPEFPTAADFKLWKKS